MFENEFIPEKVFPAILNNEWEIPILLSPKLFQVKDKKNNLSYVVDCLINNKCFNWILINESLKGILIDWCIDSIELKFHLQNIKIKRNNLKFPKMSYKGDPHSNQITVLKQSLSDNKNFDLINEKKKLNNYIKENEHLLMV
ncbi:Pih1p ASCRUDRAFT_76596, partial [Ascoidea rubescens DSM 1968]